MDQVNWLRFVLSFVFVLGLIGLSAMALKKWGGRLAIPGAGGVLPVRNNRLRVVEMCHLGPRQKLVLVRRDAVEHLLLLAGDSACVVETGIAHEE